MKDIFNDLKHIKSPLFLRLVKRHHRPIRFSVNLRIAS